MKTLKLISAASMILAAAACTKQEPFSEVKMDTLTYSLSNDRNAVAEMKSELDTDFKTVKWVSGDKVSVLEPEAAVAQTTPYAIDAASNSLTVNVTSGATYFYALYPFDKTAAISGTTINTVFPVQQNAVPGNIPANANVAVARALTSESSMVFKNLGTLMSFSLDYDDVTSVVFSGNNNEDVAGSISVTYPEGGVPSVTFGSGASKYIIVKNADDSPLVKNVKYYFVVPPQTFANGITLTVNRADGSMGSKSSTKSVTAARNGNLGLGSIAALTFSSDLYTAYMAGKNITIAGKVYNKAVNGDATLLDSDIQPDLFTSLSNKQGVFFLKGSAPFTDSNNLGLSKELVVSSNNISSPVSYTPSHRWVLNDGSLVMSNVIIDFSVSTESYLCNFSSAATEGFQAFVLDRCSLKNIQKTLLYASQNTSKGIGKISVTNSNIQYVAAAPLFNAYKATDLYRYKEIVFENNVVYSAGTFNIQMFSYDHNTAQNNSAAWDCSVMLKNNIFYNLTSSNGLIKHYRVNSLVIGGNIYYCNPSSATSSKSYYLFSADQDKSLITIAGDIHQGNTNSTWLYSGNSNGYAPGVTNAIPSETSDIFASFDTATGEYTLNPAYAGYGPKSK